MDCLDIHRTLPVPYCHIQPTYKLFDITDETSSLPTNYCRESILATIFSYFLFYIYHSEAKQYFFQIATNIPSLISPINITKKKHMLKLLTSEGLVSVTSTCTLFFTISDEHGTGLSQTPPMLIAYCKLRTSSKNIDACITDSHYYM